MKVTITTNMRQLIVDENRWIIQTNVNNDKSTSINYTFHYTSIEHKIKQNII
jgi:hypothetical protein